MITLRPYQTEIIDSVFDGWQTENDLLVVAATGAGKTNIFWEIIDRFIAQKPGARVVVLAHRKELIEQPFDRLMSFWPHLLPKSGIVMGDTDECHRQIVVATVQTLGHKSKRRIKDLLRYGKVDLLITDECFVAGTLVDGKPIESFKVGDKVTAFDEQSNTFVQSRVTRLFKNPAPSTLIKIVADGNEIVCTPDHPVFCNGEWLPAKLVTSGDYMVQYTIEEQVVTKSEDEVLNGLQEVYQAQSVCSVRYDLYTQQLEFQNDAALLGRMQTKKTGREPEVFSCPMCGMWKASRVQGQIGTGLSAPRHCLLLGRVQAKTHFSHCVRNDGRNQPQICQSAHEGKQPDVRSGYQGENENFHADNRIQGKAWGQWGANATTGSVSQCLGMGNGSCGFNRPLSGRQRLSVILQGRYRERNSESGYRSGWQKSQAPRSEGTGSEENGTPRIVRVDSVEILERGSDERFNRLCPDGFVYNLEVEKQHTYIANNLVVHNCHHVAAKSYQTVIEDLRIANPALKHLGVTATPERGDKKALGTIYKKEIANVGVIRLIDEGFLCKPVVHGVKTSIDLSGVTVHGSGGNRDYNQEQLVAAVETDDCFKLVVKTHIDKISHRPTIAFVPSVAGAYRLADMLREQGISAIAADGNTPKEERAAIIRDFKAGRYTCICNVALWTEGLDLPNLECCHLVRPTKSDALYLQMVGRVLRIHPGKELAEIFDYQPVGERNLHMRMRMLGIKRKNAYEGKAMTGSGGGPAAPLHKAGDHVEYILLDYFENTKKAWVTDDTGWRIIGFGMGDDEIDRSLAVSPDGQELWACWRKNGERWHQAKRHSATGAEAILATVEAFTQKYSSSMSMASAPWRSKPPSEGQAKFARSLGLAIDGLNAGAVSDAINKKLVLQAIRRTSVKVAA